MARLPLEGIRIIDSTYVFALPYAGGLIADLGADKRSKVDRFDAAGLSYQMGRRIEMELDKVTT